MNNYRSYFDRIEAPETLRTRLKTLEPKTERRRPPAWKRYGALAAVLVLAVGIGGAWVLRSGVLGIRVGGWNENPAVSENAVVSATIEQAPADDTEEGTETIGGFEVNDGAVVHYYLLPWIEYRAGSSESLASIAIPEDCVGRDLTRADLLALVGGEEVLETMLDWGDMELQGTVFHHADGTVWVLDLWGESDRFAFSLSLAPDTLPPTCLEMPVEGTTEVWGVEVAGYKGGAFGRGSDQKVWMPEGREVTFVANGVGVRFQAYGPEGQGTEVEYFVARLVRQAILEGLNLSAVTADGAVIAEPEAPAETQAAGSVVSQPPVQGDTPSYDPNA